jgi:arginine deiminase
MHPDTIFNRIDEDLALVYLPAFLNTLLVTRDGAREIDFAQWMRRRGVTLINVSDAEQRSLACTFVPLDRRVMLHYDTALSPRTQVTLARRGVEILFFPARHLTAGGGSLRCHTLRLHRTGNTPARAP